MTQNSYKKAISLALYWIVGLTAPSVLSNEFIMESSAEIAFTNARIIDGTGAAAKTNHTVVIREGRIVDMGPDGTVAISAKAKRLPMQGKSLLPGWVMHHEHLYYLSNYASSDPQVLTQQPFSFPRLYLSAGITSARTTGSFEPYTDLRIRQAIEEGRLEGPTLDLTAPYLEGEPNYYFQLHPLKSAEDARERVRFWAGQGFTSFKAYDHISREQLAAAVDEAHRLGLKITGHLCSVTYREAADLGIDQLEHGFMSSTDFAVDKQPDQCRHSPLPDPDDARAISLIEHLIENNVVLTSTLAIFARHANMIGPVPEDTVALLDKDAQARYKKLQGKQNFSNLGLLKARVKADMQLQAAFWRAGGTLVVGTDPAGKVTLPGHDSLMSIELLVDAGIPPLAVIKIATQNGAQAMGIAKDRGTIEVGKRADLLVIKGDPSVDIKAIHNIETVFKNGIGYNPAALKNSAVGTVGGPG